MPYELFDQAIASWTARCAPNDTSQIRSDGFVRSAERRLDHDQGTPVLSHDTKRRITFVIYTMIRSRQPPASRFGRAINRPTRTVKRLPPNGALANAK